MDKVQFFGCYDFNEDWYLVEMLLDEPSSDVDLYEFFVPDENLDEDNWQCPYLEQFLNEKGTKRICELYDEPEKDVKPCRIAFFIFKECPGILRTPYGEFTLAGSPLPKRLKDIIEFEED